MAPVMVPTDRSVPQYLATVDNAQRRADADTLVELMCDVTGEPPVVWGPSIVGFGSFHYRYATGTEGDAPLAAFARGSAARPGRDPGRSHGGLAIRVPARHGDRHGRRRGVAAVDRDHAGHLRSAKRARNRTSDRALPRFTREHAGGRRIVDEPPLITHLPNAETELVGQALDDYLATLSPHWRRVLGGYTLVDVARKVVGVGSVGLRAYVALLEGSSPDDVLFLQLKQARRSVLARYVHGDSAWHAHQGQRVVEYQQALQTVSDPLLGWTSAGDLQFYVRQFRNMKGTVPLDAIDPPALADYAGIVGHLLAKGHARTSGASMIAGYAGSSDKLDRALTRFARAYADQTEADHAKLLKAVERGVLPMARSGPEKTASAFRP